MKIPGYENGRCNGVQIFDQIWYSRKDKVKREAIKCDKDVKNYDDLHHHNAGMELLQQLPTYNEVPVSFAAQEEEIIQNKCGNCLII